MNILIAVQSLYEGGAEMAAIRLSNELAKKESSKVHFLELEFGYTRDKKFLKYLDEQVVLYQPDRNKILRKLAVIRHYGPGFLFNLITRLYKTYKQKVINNYIKANKIQIVNSHCLKTDIFFSEIKSLKWSLISSFHGHYELYEEENHNVDIENLYNELLNKIDHVVYTTDKHLNTLNRFNFPISRTTKIYYGFSRLENGGGLKYTNGEPLRICIASRAIEGKGWEELIQATINVVSNHDRQVKLDLIGNGPLLQPLKDKYERYQYIDFLGFRSHDQIIDHLNQSHLAALPSYYQAESMPNSIIEYLACGKPVITTDNGAIKDMLSYNGQYAGTVLKLVDNKVRVKDIEQTILEYIIHPEQIEEKSKIAVNAFDKFDVKHYGNNYNALFSRTLGST